ncbi:MAG: hypothetical protein NC915_03540 [Candidatus Omnitrophica bacterium]|nr:hypothetical protein [Candidatus Omnitrophota bacterium]
MRKIIFILFLFLNFSFCEEVKRIVVDSGFYDRENEVVKVEIDFGKGIDINSLKLLDKDKRIEFYFIAKEDYKGELYFIIDKLPSLTTKEYTLYFNLGKWEKKAIGNQEIYQKISSKNLIPNPGFEEVEGDKVVNWEMKDYAWVFRELPDLKSFCRVVTEDKFEGKRSLKLASEKRDDKTITGYAFSEVFPLKPKTNYKFSYRFKITKVNIEKLKTYSALSIEVQLLNEKKERIYPTDYSVNRIHLPYGLGKIPSEEYLNKWLETSIVKETHEEVRYGRIWISFWDVEAECFVDDMNLVEIEKKEPVKVKVLEK